MARKKLEEPEKWITVNGQHLPVYPGGRIGAPGQSEPSKNKKSQDNTSKAIKERPSNLRDIKKHINNMNAQAKKGDAIVMTDYFGRENTYVKLDDVSEYGWLGKDEYGNPALMDSSYLANNGRYARISLTEMAENAKYSLDKKSSFKDKSSGTDARLVTGALNPEAITAMKNHALGYGNNSFNKKKLAERYGFTFDEHTRRMNILTGRGMSETNVRKYLSYEEKASRLEHELNTTMDSHSTNWVRQRKEEIQELKDKMKTLRYGGR